MARYIKQFPFAGIPDAMYTAVNQYLVSEGYKYVLFEGENLFQKGNGIMTGPTFFKLSVIGNTVQLETWMKYALLPGVYVDEIGITGMVGWAVKGPWKRRLAHIESILASYSQQSIAQSAMPMQPPFGGGTQFSSEPIHEQKQGTGDHMSDNNQIYGDNFSEGTQLLDDDMSEGTQILVEDEDEGTCIMGENRADMGAVPAAATDGAGFCTNCGAPLTQGTVFCSACGYKVAADTPVQQPAQPIYTQPVQQPAQPAYTQPVQQPAQPVYTQPVQQPAQPVYTQPVQQPAQPVYTQPGMPMPPVGQPVSKKEFIEKYADPSIRKAIKSAAITCYVCAGLNFLVSIALNPAGIIDSLILLGLALGMHLGKSKVCAILILILSAFEVIVGIAMTGTPSGLLWLVAGISGVVTFSKVDKQYKQFTQYNG